MGIENNDSTASMLAKLQQQNELYEDNTACGTLATAPLNAEMYSFLVPDGGVYVSDLSINGRLKEKLSFTASEKYDWLTGKFGDWTWGQSTQGGPLERVFIEYDQEYLTLDHNYAVAKLNLEKNSNPGVSVYNSISKDDIIGTITITIEPDLN